MEIPDIPEEFPEFPEIPVEIPEFPKFLGEIPVFPKEVPEILQEFPELHIFKEFFFRQEFP